MKKIPFRFNRNKEKRAELAAQQQAQAAQARAAQRAQQQPSKPAPPPKDEKKLDAVEREKMINIHNRVRPQRNQNIFANPLDMGEDFVPPSFNKSDAAIKFIDNSLAPRERRLLINAMEMISVRAGSIIIRQ